MNQAQDLLSPSLGLWIWSVLLLLAVITGVFFLLRFVIRSAKKDKIHS